MVRDAARFMPSMSEAVYRDSLYEVKTVLVGNELDDGRPILFRTSDDAPYLTTIMGAKIDNVFDVLESLLAVRTAATSLTAAAKP